MKRVVETKFFHYRQNNPGGHMDRDDNLSDHVIIEALDAAHANRRALNIGMYFDGCITGQDCRCCGDRWDELQSDSVCR